jgi:chemotaxis protein MotB
MKEKPSEWIAISDLMAGVMGVVMLLLVVTVLQRQVAEANYNREIERARDKDSLSLETFSKQVDSLLKKASASDLLVFDVRSGRLTLRDSVFKRGSACLTPAAIQAVGALQAQIAAFLNENVSSRIIVEGYTDSIPVKAAVTDLHRFCTVYDDNFTLSAARAREARKALVGTLSASSAGRVVVAGYGDSRLLRGISPEDARNRRVEVSFMLDPTP